MAERKLVVKIIGDASSLERSFGRAGAASRGFGRNVVGVSASFGSLLKGVVVVDAVQKAIEGLTAAVHLGIEEFSDNTKVTAQTVAALRSTGNIAGVTAKHIDELGLSLSNLSGIDDEAVRAGENVLLSFTKIRDQAGKGNDVFTRATKAITDYAARTGKDLPVAANLIGRALENPERKAASLARAGIVLTKSQLELIKTLQDSGHALDAQKLILSELERRYKGAAEAAGKTLPGQLNILKDRFKDLAGSGIGLIAPAVAKAATGLTDFVRKLSETKGAKAKFSLVFTGVKDLGRGLLEQLKRGFDGIDFGAVLHSVGDGLKRALRFEIGLLGRERDIFVNAARAVGSRIQEAFRAIDWSAVGHAILDGLARAASIASRGVVTALRGITDALHHVNFQRVGKVLVDAFVFAVAAVGNFLLHVDWGAIIGATIRLAVTVIKGLGSLLLGAGKELGSLLIKGIVAGIRALAGVVEQAALKVVLKILKALDFKILGHSVIPGLNILISTIEGKLKSLQGRIDALHGKNIDITVTTKQVTEAPLDLGQVALARAAARAAAKKTPKVNTDLGLGLSRADINAEKAGAVAKALAKAQKAADAAAAAAAKSLQTLLDKLNLGIAKATLTKSFKDDLAANQALISALKQQIKLHKDDLSLQNALVSATLARRDLIDQQNAAELAVRNRRQFRVLGLGPTGDTLTPGIRGLKRELAKVGDAVKGSFLDTRHTRNLLATIRKLLLGGLGRLSADVRSKIKELLDGIDQQLKASQGDRQTKFRVVNTSQLLAGLGLSAEQLRSLRSRLSQVGAGGTVPSTGSVGAFGMAITVNSDVYLDGQKVGSNTTRHQQKRARGLASQRGGRSGGTRLGLA